MHYPKETYENYLIFCKVNFTKQNCFNWFFIFQIIGHVMTGLRFRTLGAHLNLEARITPINFKSGKLSANLSTWIGSDQTQVSEEVSTKVKLFLFKNKFSELSFIPIFLYEFRIEEPESVLYLQIYPQIIWAKIVLILSPINLYYLIVHLPQKMQPKPQFPLLILKK